MELSYRCPACQAKDEIRHRIMVVRAGTRFIIHRQCPAHHSWHTVHQFRPDGEQTDMMFACDCPSSTKSSGPK